MKIQKLSLIAAVLMGSLLAGGIASAQETNVAKKAPRRAPSVQERVDRLSTELKLTDAQKTKLTALFEDQAKKRQEFSSLTREERREKSRALMDEQNEKMKGILTPEQYEQWQKMRRPGRGAGEKKKAD